ncbi:hypothetical protein N0V90_011959 [Kalmusia sp. IMI 367209]|nr:hypothetical protein N0V90_011959 [Kalmusia sp. IMI 367209]
MIFRHVFPESIPEKRIDPATKENTLSISLLKVNRQISAEAMSVLYELVPFKVGIRNESICICNKTLLRYPNECGMSNHILTLDEHLEFPALKRIRNFDISVHFGRATFAPWGIGTGIFTMQYITTEDYYLYSLRNTIQKFIGLIGRAGSALKNKGSVTAGIRSLELTPRITEDRWDFDEILAAVAMVAEPLKALSKIQRPLLHEASLLPCNPKMPPRSRTNHVMDSQSYDAEYKAYQNEWQTEMSQTSGSAPESYVQPLKSRADKAVRELQKIERFVSVLRKRHLATLHPSCYSRPNHATFDGIARVLHAARLASEQYNLRALAKIREALTQRWVDYQKQQQEDNRVVADSLLDMLSPKEASKATREHKAKFSFPQQESRQIEFDYAWSELDFYKLDKVKFKGVTTSDDRERRYFTKNGKQTARLKTPQFVRILPLKVKTLH